MQEVVAWRYAKLLADKSELPDLIVIDGGKCQLSHAYEVLKELGISDIPIIGLAKRLEEVFVVGSSEALVLPRTSSSLSLLPQLRDEANRFAIEFHRSLRDTRTLNTQCAQIQVNGKKSAVQLWEREGLVDA